MSYQVQSTITSTNLWSNFNPQQPTNLEWDTCKYTGNCTDSTDSSDEETIDDPQQLKQYDCRIQCCAQAHSKLKSELCRKFMEYGYCPYEDRCTFAHGPDQLRQNQVPNMLYKTKKCFAFFGSGFCKYGQRCNYLHTRTMEDLPKTEEHNRRKWREILKYNRQTVISSRTQSRLLQLVEFSE